MRTRLLATTLALSALSVAPACKGEDPPGGLIVPFTIGAGVDCSVLGVVEVTVDILKSGASGTGETVIATETVACEDGQAEFSGIAPGRYDVRALGMDADGVVVVDNLDKDPPDQAEVTSGAQNTADDAVMRTTPAKIHVRWILGGGLDMCTDVPVADFELNFYKTMGATPLFNEPYVFACDPMEEKTPDKYFVVEDPERKLEGIALDWITIEPVDAQGMSVLDPMATKLRFAFTPPGHGRTIKLTANVDCGPDTCTITCPNVDPMDATNCLAD